LERFKGYLKSLFCLTDTALQNKKGLVEDSPQSFACYVVSVSLTLLAFEKKKGDFFIHFFILYFLQRKVVESFTASLNVLYIKHPRNH